MNRLIETVLLITHNICFGWEIKKLIFQYALLSEGLYSEENNHNFFEGYDSIFFNLGSDICSLRLVSWNFASVPN